MDEACCKAELLTMSDDMKLQVVRWPVEKCGYGTNTYLFTRLWYNRRAC